MHRGPLLDRLERRVLAAVRLVDVTTGRPIERPLSVSAEGVRFLRNRSGLHVITAAPGLEEHIRAFETPPALPVAGSLGFVLRIEDPLEVYLERLAALRLPRAARPPAGDPEALPELFQPVEIEMFPAPAAPVRLAWSGLRLTLRRADAQEPRPALAGVLAVLHRPGDASAVLGRGLSDRRGEALVLVQGLRLGQSAEGGGAVTTPVTQAELTLVLRRDGAWPVDPGTLAELDPASRRTLASVVAVPLRSGEIAPLAIEVSLADDD